MCCVRVLRFVRVFVSLLVEQGRDESNPVMVRMMCVHVCAWVCMVMPVVCWVVLFRYGGLGSFDLARLLSVGYTSLPSACLRARACV